MTVLSWLQLLMLTCTAHGGGGGTCIFVSHTKSSMLYGASALMDPLYVSHTQTGISILLPLSPSPLVERLIICMTHENTELIQKSIYTLIFTLKNIEVRF